LPQIRSDASQPHQRLAHSLIANPAAGPRSATPVHLSSPQQTHRVLAVIAALQRPSGASSQWTRRWREVDSNLYGAFPVKWSFLVCCRFFVRSWKSRSSSRRLRSGSRSARKGSRDRNGSKAWRLAG
jgi:hypothetical protein